MASTSPGENSTVTAAFTPKAMQAWGEAAMLTGDTRTDTINRAIQLCAFIEAEQRLCDGVIYIRRGPVPGWLARLLRLSRLHYQ